MSALELDRILQAHAAYAELASAFADLHTSQGTQAALALTLAASYALDVAVRLTHANPPSITDALRAAADGGLPIGPPQGTPAAAAKPSATDDTLDTDECARRVGITADTLRAMAHANKVPARKVGRAYRYHWPTICEWLGGDHARSDSRATPSSSNAETTSSQSRKPDVYAKLNSLKAQHRRRRGRDSLETGGSDTLAMETGSHTASGSASGTEKLVEQLTQEKSDAITRGGFHHDGRGLYLRIKGPSRTWVLRFNPPGRAVRVDRYLQLGSCAEISLAEARQRAAEARELIAQGVDPIARRNERNERNERERNSATEHAT